MNLFVVFKVKRFVCLSLLLILLFFLLGFLIGGSIRLFICGSWSSSWLELIWVNVHKARSGTRNISRLLSINKSHKIFCAKVLRLEQGFELNIKRLLAELSWLVVHWSRLLLLLMRQKVSLLLLLLLVWLLLLRVFGNNMAVVWLLKSFGELLCDVQQVVRVDQSTSVVLAVTIHCWSTEELLVEENHNLILSLSNNCTT